MVISLASRSASRMISSKALRRISARSRGLLRGPAGEGVAGGIDRGLGVLDGRARHRGDLVLGRRIDHVEAAAVGGFAPLAADPQIGRDIGEKIVVHGTFPMIGAMSSAAGSVGSLSHSEEGWGEGFEVYESSGNPLTPALSPNGERERTELAAACLPPLPLHRPPHAVDDAIDGRQRDVLQNVGGRQRDVRRGDPHRRAVEIVERLVGDDRDDLRAPAAQARILLDREQAVGARDRAEDGAGCRAAPASARRPPRSRSRARP